MTRIFVRLVLFGFISAFCLLFVIDMADKGVGEITGPVVAAFQNTPTVNKELELEMRKDADAAKAKVEAEKGSPVIIKQLPAMQEDDKHRLSDKIGNLLQITAYHSVKLVVSIVGALFN